MVQTALIRQTHVSPFKEQRVESVLDCVARRRSIRRYCPEPVSKQQLAQILEAMSWAPSAHNRQPLRIILIDTLEPKEALANAMGERLRADRRRDGDCPEVIEKDTQRSFMRITGAPIVLVLCADMSPMDQYPDERRQNAERLMAVQSVAVAAQNALLATHAMGLGACWMCAPLFCPETVTAALQPPEHWEPQILITLGHPANAGKLPTRIPVSEIVWRPQNNVS